MRRCHVHVVGGLRVVSSSPCLRVLQAGNCSGISSPSRLSIFGMQLVPPASVDTQMGLLDLTVQLLDHLIMDVD